MEHVSVDHPIIKLVSIIQVCLRMAMLEDKLESNLCWLLPGLFIGMFPR